MAPMPRLLVSSAACACLMLLCRVGAVEHVVGDAGFGWDSGINYAAWARDRTFTVGDVLVFQYVSSQHNVYEVTQSTYRSCDVVGNGGGVLTRYTSGDDRVLLAEPRSYWFICQFPGHCLGGMKLTVNVSAGGASGTGALSPANNAPPSSSVSAAAALSLTGCWLATGLTLGLGMLEFMNWWAIK